MPIVRDVNRFYVDNIQDAAYNRTGSGLLFLVRWDVPGSDDTWEPLRNVKDTAALSTFLRSSSWRSFSNTADFRRFSNRYPNRVPHVDVDDP